MSTIRFFAGAAEAAGTDSLPFEVSTQRTITDIVRHLGTGNERLAKVLANCTFLLNGGRAETDDPLPTEDFTLDVLPPFAGG